MSSIAGRPGSMVLGVHVDALTWDGACGRMLSWARARESRYVCVCNVHSVMMSRGASQFRQVLVEADLVTSDGMPLVWWLRRSGFHEQERIDGPELMLKLCRAAAHENVGVFLYGGTEQALALLRRRLAARFPGLRIVGALSPPYRALTPEEDREVVEKIDGSGAGIVFVGLGCPKQETWMRERRGQVQAVMIGVGAAFDFHAGLLRRAPAWMQRSGLEWFYRLACEPRRLWRRYLITNVGFVIQTVLDSLRGAGPRGRNAPQSVNRHE